MKPLTILVADLDDIGVQIVTDVIEEEYEHESNMIFLPAQHAEEIHELAAKHDIDLFVLFLNNIMFPADNLPPQKRMQQSIELVAELKAEYGKPIIALSGLPEYANQAKEAGADFFFKTPFDLAELGQAVINCLNDGVSPDSVNACAEDR